MIKTKAIGEFIELSSDKFIRKIGKKETDKRFIMPTEDTVDMYEEVDEQPKYTEAEYKAKVRELMAQKYSIEDEIALINNMNIKEPLAEHIIEYDDYMTFRDECKAKAKEELENRTIE